CIELPELELQQLAAAGYRVKIRKHRLLALPGYDIFSGCAYRTELIEALCNAGAASAESETYNILRIEAGVPVFGIDIDDNRFVVEIGRTKQAISYTKGCYLGQEPIVMARDRGHANRSLMGLRVRATEQLPAGTKLLRDGKEIGEVTSSVVSPRFGSIALG